MCISDLDVVDDSCDEQGVRTRRGQRERSTQTEKVNCLAENNQRLCSIEIDVIAR